VIAVDERRVICGSGDQKEDSHAILECLRDAVERAKIRTGESDLCLTVSIGLTELETEPGKNIRKILNAAIIRAGRGVI
jgi:PleD family two-component response regulator